MFLFSSCISVCVALPVAKTAVDGVEKKAICLSFSATSLSLDDLFDCIAAFSSGFGQFSQRKPCHNSEFLTRLQLPGWATADQHRINTWEISCSKAVHSTHVRQRASKPQMIKLGGLLYQLAWSAHSASQPHCSFVSTIYTIISVRPLLTIIRVHSALLIGDYSNIIKLPKETSKPFWWTENPV